MCPLAVISSLQPPFSTPLIYLRHILVASCLLQVYFETECTYHSATMTPKARPRHAFNARIQRKRRTPSLVTGGSGWSSRACVFAAHHMFSDVSKRYAGTIASNGNMTFVRL